MHVSAVEGPTGEAVFKAGGEHSWQTGSHKGWHWSLEWAKNGRKFPRVLVIWPETLVGKNVSQPGMWSISHTAMVEFLDFDKDGIATGRPSDFLFEEAGMALPMLGKDPHDKQALFSLVDVVMKVGPEMARQPVAPVALRRAIQEAPMWEMTAVDKNSGKVVRESEV
jgi:hypothetical protein